MDLLLLVDRNRFDVTMSLSHALVVIMRLSLADVLALGALCYSQKRRKVQGVLTVSQGTFFVFSSGRSRESRSNR